MTLRARMMVAFAYLLLLSIVALSIPLAFVVDRHARNTLAIRLVNRAEAVAAAVPDALAEGGTALHSLVREDSAAGRVIVTDGDGVLIADSTNRRPLGRDYTNRPEIVEALEGRSTRLVRDYRVAGRQYVVAVPVVDAGRVIGAVRVNRRVEQVNQLVQRRLQYVAGVSAAILLVGLLVSALLARSLAKPLRRLAGVAREIGEGHLGARAPATGQPEVAEVTAALNAMSKRIEQTMTAQTDFVANASHQLRTPLTGLRLRLEALQAQGVAGVDAALAETDRLTGLVGDLLMLVRMGTAPLESETTDIAEAAEQAVDRWSAQAAEQDHVLALDGVERPLPGAGAAGDLAIILDNLIENALKYTPPGATITVGAARRHADDDCVMLTVTDDGPGMAPEDRERAFERFYRGSTGRSAPGTGLGLAIVRQIAERWGGDVELDTTGAGTCFRVYLPAADVPVKSETQLAGTTSSVR